MPNILCSIHEVWLEHWRSASTVLSGSTNRKCPDKSALRNNIAQVNAVAVVKENTAQG